MESVIRPVVSSTSARLIWMEAWSLAWMIRLLAVLETINNIIQVINKTHNIISTFSTAAKFAKYRQHSSLYLTQRANNSHNGPCRPQPTMHALMKYLNIHRLHKSIQQNIQLNPTYSSHLPLSGDVKVHKVSSVVLHVELLSEVSKFTEVQNKSEWTGKLCVCVPASEQVECWESCRCVFGGRRVS
jgi:hypothetical protein